MRSHILHVRCERRPSKSDFSALSCCTPSAAMSLSGAYVCVCVCVCVRVCARVGMGAYLVCPAWARRLIALVCRLLLEAVAARRPRRPVCTCLFDQPGCWPAGSRGAAARRSRCRSHAVCLGGRGGRGAWWCAAVHGGRSSARSGSSVERKDKLPAWAAPTVVTARSPSLDVGALVAVANDACTTHPLPRAALAAQPKVPLPPEQTVSLRLPTQSAARPPHFERQPRSFTQPITLPTL